MKKITDALQLQSFANRYTNIKNELACKQLSLVASDGDKTGTKTVKYFAIALRN